MPTHERYESGVVIEQIEVPATIEDVKAEAQRRIMALVGATSLEGCIIKQLNAQAREIELADAKQSRALTEAETTEADALRLLASNIRAIRAASNAIEAAPPIEVGIDPRWPA